MDAWIHYLRNKFVFEVTREDPKGNYDDWGFTAQKNKIKLVFALN